MVFAAEALIQPFETTLDRISREHNYYFKNAKDLLVTWRRNCRNTLRNCVGCDFGNLNQEP